MCEATVIVIVNDIEKEVLCHSIANHGLGHVFDIGTIPADASFIVVQPARKDSKFNPRDCIIKWTPV